MKKTHIFVQYLGEESPVKKKKKEEVTHSTFPEASAASSESAFSAPATFRKQSAEPNGKILFKAVTYGLIRQ